MSKTEFMCADCDNLLVDSPYCPECGAGTVEVFNCTECGSDCTEINAARICDDCDELAFWGES